MDEIILHPVLNKKVTNDIDETALKLYLQHGVAEHFEKELSAYRHIVEYIWVYFCVQQLIQIQMRGDLQRMES